MPRVTSSFGKRADGCRADGYRAAFGGLPTGQVVAEDSPCPPVELVTIAAGLRAASSSPAVPVHPRRAMVGT
jgi:hypothetical protein